MAKMELEIGLGEKSVHTLNNEIDTGILAQQLRMVAERKIQAITRRTLSVEEYDNPNWAFKQADGVGYARAYQEIVNLITNQRKQND